MKLIDIHLTGKPCAGKDTAANYICNEFGFVHFRAGAYLTKAYIEEYGEDSQFMKDLYAGKMSNAIDGSNKIVNYVETELMKESSDINIVYDGYPRTLDQWENHLKISNRRKNSLKIFIIMNISDERVIERCMKRFICHDCMRSQHSEMSTPIEKCLYCYSSNIGKRIDDTESNVKERLKYYYQKTAGLETLQTDISKKIYVHHINTDECKDLKSSLNEIIIPYYGS